MSRPKEIAALVTVLAIAAASPPPGLATQNSRVVGVVVDDATGEPLDEALVILEDGRETQTDVRGLFLFTDVRPGDYRIAAVSRGCGEVVGSFAVGEGERKLLKLVIDSPELRWSESTESRGAATQVIRRDQLRAAGPESLMEVLRRHAPDIVNSNPVSGASVSIRGRGSITASDDPVVVVDGVKIRERVGHLLSTIPASDVRRVRISRGAAGGFIYGDGASNGVIEITTRTGTDEPDPERPASTCGFSWD